MAFSSYDNVCGFPTGGWSNRDLPSGGCSHFVKLPKLIYICYIVHNEGIIISRNNNAVKLDNYPRFTKKKIIIMSIIIIIIDSISNKNIFLKIHGKVKLGEE